MTTANCTMTSPLVLSLSLCVVTIIQLTSSQSTYDVVQEEVDSCSSGRTEQLLDQLTDTVAQLQRDVAELKTRSRQKDARGKINCLNYRTVCYALLFTDEMTPLSFDLSQTFCNRVTSLINRRIQNIVTFSSLLYSSKFCKYLIVLQSQESPNIVRFSNKMFQQ